MDKPVKNTKTQSPPKNPKKDLKLEKLENDLTQANQQIQELTESAKRALADLQNYKKRTEEEKSSFVSLANATLIEQILPILDSFNRAFQNTPENLKNNEWIQGIIAIEKQLVGALEKEGLKEIPTKDQPFNPHLHEALMQGPGEKDQITAELEKGYTLNEKVIRPAKVKIGDGS